MGNSPKFPFPLPGRRQKRPAPPTVLAPLISKAQKILGSCELNVEGLAADPKGFDPSVVTPRETASTSSVSLDRTTEQHHRQLASPAFRPATALPATDLGDGADGGLGIVMEDLGAFDLPGRPLGSSGNRSTKATHATQQWEDESAIIPRHIFSGPPGDTSDRRPGGTKGVSTTTTIHGPVTESSSLRHQQSNSTITSFYEKAKMPLSISQQTSSSAMAKGLPTKAEVLLNTNSQSDPAALSGGGGDAGPSSKARPKTQPRLKLSSPRDRSRGAHRHVGPSCVSDGHNGLVLGEDLVNKSPSLLSDTTISLAHLSRHESHAKRFFKNPFRIGELSRRASTQPPPRIPEKPQQLPPSVRFAGRTNSPERRHKVTRSTVILNHLYEHYEQRTLHDMLEHDLNETIDDTASEAANQEAAHDGPPIEIRTLSSSIGEGEYDASISSSRPTRTSNASKRAYKPEVDLKLTSVLSLSSDDEGGDEDDATTDGGAPSRNASGRSRGAGTSLRTSSAMMGSHSQRRLSTPSDTASSISQDSHHSPLSRRSQGLESGQEGNSKAVKHPESAGPAGSTQYRTIPHALSTASSAGHDIDPSALQPELGVNMRALFPRSPPVGIMAQQPHHAVALPVSPPSSRLSTVSATSTNPSFVSWGNNSNRDSMSIHEVLAVGLSSSASQPGGAHSSTDVRRRSSQLVLTDPGMVANFSLPEQHRPYVASSTMLEQLTPPISPTSVDFYLASRGSYSTEGSVQCQQPNQGQQHRQLDRHPPLVSHSSRTSMRRNSASGHAELGQHEQQQQQQQPPPQHRQNKQPSSHARSASQRSNKIITTEPDAPGTSAGIAPATAVGSETHINTTTTTTTSVRYMAVTRQEEMLLAALRTKRARMREDIIAEFEEEIVDEMLMGSQEGAAGVASAPSTSGHDKTPTQVDFHDLHGSRAAHRHISTETMHTRIHPSSVAAALAARPHMRGTASARRPTARESAGARMESVRAVALKSQPQQQQQQVGQQEDPDQDPGSEEEDIFVMMSQLSERPGDMYKDVGNRHGLQAHGEQQARPIPGKANAGKRLDAFLDFDDETDRVSGEELIQQRRRGSLPVVSARTTLRPGSMPRPKTTGSAKGLLLQRQQYQRAREQYQQQHYQKSLVQLSAVGGVGIRSGNVEAGWTVDDV